MLRIEGTNNISCTVIADSVCVGSRMVTMELEYPRFIHAELMTHRMLSKNAASSRAIPIKKMHETITEKTAMPVHWGKNQPGMSAKEEVDDLVKQGAEGVWNAARDSMLSHSTVMSDMGLHKQIANRITEPFQMMKTVISGTEWANLIWLRHHADAQPEFYELADCIVKCLKQSESMLIVSGEWHTPYVHRFRDIDGVLQYLDSNGEKLSKEDAIKVSSSCCAQVSYRRNDDSLEKAKDIFARLIESEPIHASPIEHQATPMKIKNAGLYSQDMNPTIWEEGITHMDRDKNYWSGNLRGFIQHRKLIKCEAKWE
jgi:thymidylate synthase ThyX